MNSHLFIFGYGFTSTAIAERMRRQFDLISGTTRSSEKAEFLKSAGINPVLFDGVELDPFGQEQLATASHVLISIGPNAEGDPVLNACRTLLAQNKNLQWLGYLSTVGVYGDHNGEWVDETTICKPVSTRSIQRVDAEQQWQDFANQHALPLAIFRLSGIYGPGRNAFMNIEKGTARRLVKPGQVFNRIHREDIAQAVDKAIERNASGIFNITDDEPAPPQDVVTFAHQLYGKAPPDEIDFATADLSPMARSFYGENKRVSNSKSKQVLGMTYVWPNYKVSLKRMWDEKTWRS